MYVLDLGLVTDPPRLTRELPRLSFAPLRNYFGRCVCCRSVAHNPMSEDVQFAKPPGAEGVPRCMGSARRDVRDVHYRLISVAQKALGVRSHLGNPVGMSLQ